MNTFRVVASLLVLAPLSAALASESATSDASSEAVATLKSRLTSTLGFKVDNVHMASDGTACISYRVSNDNGGESRVKAVVQGEKILRSTSRNSDFAKTWNSKCVASGGDKPEGA
jgi:hypothetical protein